MAFQDATTTACYAFALAAGTGMLGTIRPLTAAAPTPRVAVAGCGYWGQNHLRVLASLGALAAVHDPDPERAKAAEAEYGVPALTRDDVHASDGIDAVVIAAPAVHHAELAAAALRAGKHTFVEKPLALEVGEAEALCDLAEAADCVLMVGHLLQYHPAFLAMRDLVDTGVLGKVHYLYSNRLNLGKIRREENILWSFAPHDISMILTLVGEDPVSVRAVGGWYLSDQIADVTTTHLAFPGGVRAHIFVSWLHPYKEQRLVVVGDEAMAVFDDTLEWDEKLVVYRHTVDMTSDVPQPTRADAEPVALQRDEPLVAELGHFLECVTAGTTPRTDGREGVRVLRVLHEAEEALLESRP